MPDPDPKIPAPDPAKGPDVAKLIEDATKKIVADVTAVVPTLIDAALAKHKPNPPKPDDKDNKDNKGNEADALRETVKALKSEFEKNEKDLAAERARNAVAAAVAKVPFYDPQEAIAEISPKVVKKNDLYVVPTTKLIGSTPVPEDISLDAAVQALAANKKHWVKQTVNGGTGATGGGDSFNFEKDPTYGELLDPANGKMLADFQAKHPDRFAKIQRDGLVGLQKGK